MSDIESEYRARYPLLVEISNDLRGYLESVFEDFVRIDSITTRAKCIDRFVEKARKIANNERKYIEPLNQIQDQIGARIVTYYLDDVIYLGNKVREYFKFIEDKSVVPDSDSEFGYFGKHFILLLPTDIKNSQSSIAPNFFELQIKTLFQHAWSEANHDLGYKPNSDLSSEIKRKIAFTSAQAWGADMIFNDLRRKIQKT